MRRRARQPQRELGRAGVRHPYRRAGRLGLINPQGLHIRRDGLQQPQAMAVRDRDETVLVRDRDETALAGGRTMQDFRLVPFWNEIQRAPNLGGNLSQYLTGGQPVQLEHGSRLTLHRLHLQETLNPTFRQLDLMLDGLAVLGFKRDGLFAHFEMRRLAGPQLRQMVEKGAVEIDVGRAVAMECPVFKSIFGEIGAGVDAGATGEAFQPWRSWRSIPAAASAGRR